jgi:hypothetical protein
VLDPEFARVGRVGADHVADDLVPVEAATRGPLRSSAGEAAAICSKAAQAAVISPASSAAAAGVTAARSASAVILPERAAAFGCGERGRGPDGHPLGDIEGDRGPEADPGVCGHRRMPPRVAGQRRQRGTLVAAGAAPAGPVQRGGDGLLRGHLEADRDAGGTASL